MSNESFRVMDRGWFRKNSAEQWPRLSRKRHILRSWIRQNSDRRFSEFWRIQLHFLALVFLTALLFFPFLGTRDLHSSHEARAAQNAQSILDNDQWLLPQLFDRQVDLQKPPLYYWLVAWLTQCWGGRVEAWLVRLPTALSACLTVWVIFAFAARRGRPMVGFLAATMLATCLHFTWLGRVGRIDMPLTLSITIALVCLYEGGRWLWPAYVAMGLGLLLKGPIALVMPLVVMVPWLLWRKRSASPFSALLGFWWGVPLAVLIALPWYVLANHATRGDFFRVFFWYHNVARGFGGAEELPAYPWWFYGPRLLLDLLPWSLLLLPAIWVFIRRQRWRHDRLASFGLGWLLVVVLVLSCLRFKRADYLLPAYPGAALFFGCMLERAWHRWPRVASWIWGVVVLGCVAGWWIYNVYQIPVENARRPDRHFAEAIRRHTEETVLFFRTEAHAVAFYTRPPLVTILEWSNLDTRGRQQQTYYVVMPVTEFRRWREYLKHCRLEEVARNEHMSAGVVERPLVLARTYAVTKEDD